jgi:peptide/nickel transport system permease protein
VAAVADVVAAAGATEHEGGSHRRWYRIPTLVGGMVILGVIVVMAIIAPLITKYDPAKQDLLHTLAKPGTSGHLLGTDDLGRDVWSRLVYGARTDLRVAFLAVVLPFILGSTLGLLAGYFAGKVDTVVNWLVSVVVAFPFYVLIIAIVFAIGPGSRGIYIAITIVGWVSYTRIIRAEVFSHKRREYVLAARAGGLSTPRILVRHILPNVVTQAVVFACSDIVLDLIAIVTLGYLGLGVQPPTPDWGRMMADGQTYITTRWELVTIPGIAVVITAFGLALVADGLADLLRPE